MHYNCNSGNAPDVFDNRTQWLIAFYGLFIAFPVLDIPFVVVSITFPIFLLILYRVSRQYGQILFVNKTLDKLMLWFIFIAGLSLFLQAPVDQAPGDQGGLSLVINDAKSILYLAYWFSVYLFFKQWYAWIDLKRLSLFSLVGLILCSQIVLFGSTVQGWYIWGWLRITQNGYAFNTVACLGISCIYIFKRYRLFAFLALGIFFTYTMFISGSRAGGILIMMQCLAMAMLVVTVNRRMARKIIVITATVTLTATVLLGVSLDYSAMGRRLAYYIHPYNAELAELLRDSEKVLEFDKPWQSRKTQVEKGIYLFKKHPVTGIGWGHFKYVRAHINMRKYKNLNLEYDAYALTRSSHNSYIQVLAETGVLGIVPIILIQLFVLMWMAKVYIYSRSIIEPCLLGMSLLGVALYFWVISAITGAVWYFVLGLFAGAVNQKRIYH